MRSPRRLLVLASVTLLLGQTACAARGAGGPAPTASAGERPEASRTVSARDGETSRAGRGWTAGARACVRDFVAGKGFDPTVMVMLPLVMPVCAVIGALDIQPEHPSTVRATSDEEGPRGMLSAEAREQPVPRESLAPRANR